jgi:hypothetical protein
MEEDDDDDDDDDYYDNDTQICSFLDIRSDGADFFRADRQTR